MSYNDSYLAGEVRSEAEARKQLTEAELWLKKIDQAKDNDKRKAWLKDAKNAITMYEASSIETTDNTNDELSGANLWHSNVETVVPALYNSKPLPDVRIRFGDPDPIQKAVSDLAERMLSVDLDSYDYDDMMKEVVSQAEMTGWGIPRLRYFPQLETVTADTIPDGQAEAPTYDRLVRDDVRAECHPWDRLIIPAARSPEKLPWMAFSHDLTLDEIDDLVPPTQDEESGEMIPASARFSPSSTQKQDKEADTDTEDKGIAGTVPIYEVWDARTKTVLWLSPKDKKTVLRKDEDPLQLSNFFPVPKILYAKRRRSSVQPISPWAVFKNLFQEFEKITQRINGLVDQIKVTGLVDKALQADLELLRNCRDGEYVPVSTDTNIWQQGSKGIEGAIAHWPLQQLMATLKEAVQHRDLVKQLIFETTGISDILRGSTNPNETLGAQKIKASWGSQRIQDMQSDVAEVNRAIIRAKAEIRQRLTPWRLIKEMTGITFEPDLPEPPQPTGDPQQDAMAQQQYAQAVEQAQQGAAEFEKKVEEAFRSRSRMFRIDIETDSTIRADIGRDQEQIGAFVNYTGQFMTGAVAAIQLLPETREPLFQVYASLGTRFKLGRQAEAALQKLAEAAAKPMAQQGGAAQADPAQQQREQQMQEAEGAQQQAQQQHEQTQLDKEQSHEKAMAEHDAATRQTAALQIQLKDQADANKHSRSLEKMQIQRAMAPVNGALNPMVQ